MFAFLSAPFHSTFRLHFFGLESICPASLFVCLVKCKNHFKQHGWVNLSHYLLFQVSYSRLVAVMVRKVPPSIWDKSDLACVWVMDSCG